MSAISINSYQSGIKAVVVGAHGGIGAAFVKHLAGMQNVAAVYACSRRPENAPSEKIQHLTLDFENEESVVQAAAFVKEQGGVNLVIVASGILHDGDGLQPEKALREITPENFRRVLHVNTIGPALVAKHFLPLFPKDERAIFAALSARVGSISDNRLGGWTAYRASKAALNMVIKNAAIEMGRRYKQAVVVGLHPGTVDTGLSKPFQGQVPEGKLFDPIYSTAQMLQVLDGLSPQDSGGVFDYAGMKIEP